MDEILEFADERQKTWCVHCGQALATLEVNRDHVPSKGLLLEPYPDNLPCVDVCKPCNGGCSLDEEYLIAFLSCVLSGSTDPERQLISTAARILERSVKLRQRIDRAKTECMTLGGDTRCVWAPEAERIDRIALKNARGHAFFEFGEPMLQRPTHIWSSTLATLTIQQREAFERIDTGGLLPEVGSRMLTRVMTGQDLSDGWVIVQDRVYRYSVAQQGVMLVRSVLFEYLATEVWWSE